MNRWKIKIAVIWLFLYFSYCLGKTVEEQRIYLRDEVKKMFYHAYDNYMLHAFPKDEVEPIACKGKDTWGSYSLTLIDSLDTLLVLGNTTEFKKGVKWVLDNISFDKDLNVSVFETNIRILGGLLSAHLLALDSNIIDFKEYNGGLLNLAIDLGNRLLPAFDTPTKIPYGTVNLKYGVPPKEVQITCTSGAGTFSLEFGILSKLTGDSRYERAAKDAVNAIWNHRSSLNLVGNHINIATGDWIHRDAGIGHGIDSFYEYLLKSAIYFNDAQYMDIFVPAYQAAMKHLKRGDFYVEVELYSGSDTWPLFNNLQAFWPGMQVLYGDVDSASRTAWAFFTIWKQRGFTPEKQNLINARLVNGQTGYPLRPELIESIWYLANAYPKESAWFYFAREILYSLNSTRVQCGYAAIDNVDEGTIINRMDSFFLAETLKYLYLIFDKDNFLNRGNFIFNTEAHPFPLNYSYMDPSSKGYDICPIFLGYSNPFWYDNDIYQACSMFLQYVQPKITNNEDKKKPSEHSGNYCQDGICR